MTWALACTGAFALLGWGAAFVMRGLLAVNRRRVSKLRGDLGAARYDLAFATEELAKAFDRVNKAEGRLRAQEMRDQGVGWADLDPKRRAN